MHKSFEPCNEEMPPDLELRAAGERGGKGAVQEVVGEVKVGEAGGCSPHAAGDLREAHASAGGNAAVRAHAWLHTWRCCGAAICTGLLHAPQSHRSHHQAQRECCVSVHAHNLLYHFRVLGWTGSGGTSLWTSVIWDALRATNRNLVLGIVLLI